MIRCPHAATRHRSRVTISKSLPSDSLPFHATAGSPSVSQSPLPKCSHNILFAANQQLHVLIAAFNNTSVDDGATRLRKLGFGIVAFR